MDKILIFENTHTLPESEANNSIKKLGNGWEVVSAVTTCSMIDTTRSGGSDKLYITTVVVREKKKR